MCRTFDLLSCWHVLTGGTPVVISLTCIDWGYTSCYLADMYWLGVHQLLSRWHVLTGGTPADISLTCIDWGYTSWYLADMSWLGVHQLISRWHVLTGGTWSLSLFVISRSFRSLLTSWEAWLFCMEAWVDSDLYVSAAWVINRIKKLISYYFYCWSRYQSKKDRKLCPCTHSIAAKIFMHFSVDTKRRNKFISKYHTQRSLHFKKYHFI